MDELISVDGEKPILWRVKKQLDNTIYGPVDEATLKEWADSAQISPEDMIDSRDESWEKAPNIEFLRMFWMVQLPGNEVYGPTTLGTLCEFIGEGLITEKTIATHVNTGQSLPVAALLAAVEFEKKRADKRPQKSQTSTASLAVDMAKDQRILQLETDLSALRKEHESLTHKFRQLTLQLQEGTKLGRK